MFLHASWLHIVGNMWLLWVFGNNVEDRLGHVTFLVFYLLTGFVASLCHWVNDPNSAIPVIGASGAVSGVLGAYAVTFPSARVRSLIFLVFIFLTVDLPAMVVLGFWFLGQVLEATASVDVGFNGGVAWWAHIGGFVVGLTVMPWLDRERHEVEESPTSWLVPLGWPF
jgi:membrane associated rhomboid family serine protease